MLRSVALFVVWCSLLPSAEAKDLLDVALEIRDAVHERARQCGLTDVDAYDAAAAKPSVPAHRAWLRQTSAASWQTVAFSHRDTLFGGQRFVEKAVNGGALGWVRLEADSHIAVGRPTTGTVAHANVFYSPAGEHFAFYCNSQSVNYAAWQACVREQFVKPTALAMCVQ